jgi:hypothetical protein
MFRNKTKIDENKLQQLECAPVIQPPGGFDCINPHKYEQYLNNRSTNCKDISTKTGTEKMHFIELL